MALSRISFVVGLRCAREQLVRELRRVLRTRDLRRVQSAADVDERNALRARAAGPGRRSGLRDARDAG